MRHLARLLIEQGCARPGLTHAEIADVLAVLTDTAVIDQLFTAHGQSPDAVLRRLWILANSILPAQSPLPPPGEGRAEP